MKIDEAYQLTKDSMLEEESFFWPDITDSVVSDAIWRLLEIIEDLEKRVADLEEVGSTGTNKKGKK